MAEPGKGGKGRVQSMAASGPVMSVLERLNDLIHLPVIEDFTWYGESPHHTSLSQAAAPQDTRWCRVGRRQGGVPGLAG